MATFLALLAGCKVNDEKMSLANKESLETEKVSRQFVEEATDWDPSTYETINNLDGVTMTVKEGTASSTGLTVVMENNSDNQCIYGEFFELEKKIDETWYRVPVAIDDNYGFNSIGYDLSPGDSREWEVDWNWLYGSLEPGNYRIIKDIVDLKGTGDYETYYLAAEFSISEGNSNNSADDSLDKGKKISSIEIIRQSDKKEWILSDEDIINKFIRALNDRQKTNSKIDIRPQDYSVKLNFIDESNEVFGLWIDEDTNVQGILMSEDTTWFINKESNLIFKEILK